MSVTTLLAGAATLVALASWVVARRARRHAAQLQDMYWQLRFDYTELKARLDRVAPAPGAEPRTPAGTQFVPLSQVKR